MSSEPLPAPPVAPSEAAPPAQDPSLPPVAPLKPLLNPLQDGNDPTPSTIVEPPRSPNPQNPATDERGNNAELDIPSASASVVGPGEVNGAGSSAPQSAATSPAPPITREDTAPPPLPTTAPVPPTPPQPKDEAPPILPPGAIPPAVSTPTVITTEDQDVFMASGEVSTSDVTAAPEAAASAPIAPPTPAESPVPAPQATETQAMEVDPPAQPESLAPGMESRGSEGSLKRAGEDLEGREEKRIKDESGVVSAAEVTPVPALVPGVQSSQVQTEPVPAAAVAPTSAAEPVAQAAPAPTSAPILPQLLDPNAPPPPWLSYTPPPPKSSGPTTPLTITQHKHLLASVRSLKKIKEAANFLEPVDVIRFGIPHYAQIIDRPVDIGTIEVKLIVSDPRGPPKDKSKMSKWDPSKGHYNNVSEVVQDLRQVWENTRKFNGPDHLVSVAAKKLDDTFEKMFANMPPEPMAPPPPAIPSPQAAAGPSSHGRRPSISQAPVIRRSSDGLDTRPKREIHPPPSKDLNYAEGTRKPKRRNDPQLQWAIRTLKSFETTNKFYTMVSPFLYPVSEIITAIPTYTTVIKRPIDLLQIKEKLDDGDYDDISQVDDDIKLMIKNAQTFNRSGDEVHTAATQLAQAWGEKMKTLPAKNDGRDTSEDILGEDVYEEDSDDEDGKLQELEKKVAALNQQIADVKARQARRRAKPPKKAKNGKAGRKQSMTSASPGVNGNGYAKKPKKSYRSYDDDEEAEETSITLTQKQELAEKIQEADSDTLGKAINIIQQSTQLGQNNEEIELDIDSLPPATVVKLYKLVCGGRKLGRNKGLPGKKPGRKATGGANRKTMNEQEEAARIARMEAQLQSFGGGGGAPPGHFDGGEESESSEDESSDED